MWAATILALTFDLSLPVCVYSASDDERNIEAMATKRVQPAYPPMAQKYRIEGMVVVQVSVGGDGKVSKAEFVRGHNIFRSVSLDAAKRWEFRPPGSSGMSGTVRFVFKLSS
jgi:TonB family protein